MTRPRFKLLDGSGAVRYAGPLVKLYAVVYAQPPYEEGPEQVAEFAAKLPKEMNRKGFSLVVATEGSALVGAAYGWTMPGGQWWSADQGEPPAWLRAAPKFAVMEWIVHPDSRGQGTGETLIIMLLRDRREPWATLASDPRSAARKMYERAGWQQVGSSKLPWGVTMDLLALPLAPSCH